MIYSMLNIFACLTFCHDKIRSRPHILWFGANKLIWSKRTKNLRRTTKWKGKSVKQQKRNRKSKSETLIRSLDNQIFDTVNLHSNTHSLTILLVVLCFGISKCWKMSLCLIFVAFPIVFFCVIMAKCRHLLSTSSF